MKLMVFSAAMLLFAVHPSKEFVPRTLHRYLLNVYTLEFSSYITHKDMTRSAVLSVVADILRDNPNPADSDGSRERISALNDQDLDERRLLSAYYGENRPVRVRELKNAVKIIMDENAEVDSKEKQDAAAHFDSEKFQAGQNRLVEKRQLTVAYILRKNFAIARKETGRLLHTLQDFYSHSNWIENGNLSPYRVLGKLGERPENIAHPQTRTCRDCRKVDTFGRISKFLGFTESSSVYDCNNNLDTTLLTSGYHGGQKDNKKQIIAKPTGKCSHGGFLDSASDSSALGGINKDSPNDKWSPHHYLFDDAARVSVQATIDFLQDLRNEINDDVLFASLLGMTLDREGEDEVESPEATTAVSSVAYVIDTTGSMSEELPEIQATIPTIRQDLINAFGTDTQVRYILVPFNDPDPGLTYVTQNIENFLAGIAELRADGGGDTPEPSIGALIRAVRASDPGTAVFVFTDAPASDEHLVNEALALITNKRITVYFALVNTFGGRRRRALSDTQQLKNNQLQKQTRHHVKRQSESNVYEQIAILSGGQILNINTRDISELGSLVSFSAIQGHTAIFGTSSVAFDTVEHFFPIDIFCTEIIITISGDSVVPTVSTPEGADAATLPQYRSTFSSTTLFIAQINITDNGFRGTWRLSIASRGTYSIQVVAVSELTFSLTLFQSDPTNDYGISEVSGKPLNGEQIIALIELLGMSQSDATVTTINLINGQGTLLLSITNVTQLDMETSFFVQYLQPEESYQVQLIGMDSSGFSFSRISGTSIESTSISLTLGEDNSGSVVLRPGENTTVSLNLMNNGSASAFNLTVTTVITGATDENTTDTDIFNYFVNPENTQVLLQNSNAPVNVEVYLADNATDGIVITFTVVASSTTDARVNNFVTFDVVTTTLPPPKFTENDYADSGTPQVATHTSCIMQVILATLAILHLSELYN